MKFGLFLGYIITIVEKLEEELERLTEACRFEQYGHTKCNDLKLSFIDGQLKLKCKKISVYDFDTSSEITVKENVYYSVEKSSISQNLGFCNLEIVPLNQDALLYAISLANKYKDAIDSIYNGFQINCFDESKDLVTIKIKSRGCGNSSVSFFNNYTDDRRNLDIRLYKGKDVIYFQFNTADHQFTKSNAYSVLDIEKLFELDVWDECIPEFLINRLESKNFRPYKFKENEKNVDILPFHVEDTLIRALRPKS